jgi:hypothetical protein
MALFSDICLETALNLPPLEVDRWGQMGTNGDRTTHILRQRWQRAKLRQK